MTGKDFAVAYGMARRKMGFKSPVEGYKPVEDVDLVQAILKRRAEKETSLMGGLDEPEMEHDISPEIEDAEVDHAASRRERIARILGR